METVKLMFQIICTGLGAAALGWVIVLLPIRVGKGQTKDEREEI